MTQQIIAHLDKENGKEQSLLEHSRNVATLSSAFLRTLNLSNVGYLSGFLHDLGKSKQAFQDYIRDTSTNAKKTNHAFAGAIYIHDQYHEEQASKIAVEIIATVIACHHIKIMDLMNCDGELIYFQKMKKDKDEIDFEESVKKFFETCGEVDLSNLAETSFQEINMFIVKLAKEALLPANQMLINHHSKKKPQTILCFFIHLLLRMVQSALRDADCYDTYCFMGQKTIRYETDRQFIWQTLSDRLENHLLTLKNTGHISTLNKLRNDISDECKAAGSFEQGIYQLSAPTGSGKTLSSLRFALAHAKKHKHIRHIIYVIPYLSILTQNADTLRKVLDEQNEDLILEHYSSVLVDDEDKHKLYTARWDQPIILTSYVQLLNTLFDGSKQCVRRMHQLADSIIIFDEIQSMPITCTNMFQTAACFLTGACNSTILLCSATQPYQLSDQEQSSCLIGKELLKEKTQYTKAFQRVQITDLTEKKLDLVSLKGEVFKEMEKRYSALVIVNQKRQALALYHEMLNDTPNDVVIFFLANTMCTQHKEDTIKALHNALAEKSKKVICISTSLIEAGVDISFETVWRSCAGLDSIIQAAGRCNRNCEYKTGYVYIYRDVGENLKSLKEIAYAQEITLNLLHELRWRPQDFDNDLLSEKALQWYYHEYYAHLKPDTMDYPYTKPNTTYKTLYDLLSENRVGYQALKEKDQQVLHQAFETAGEIFEVIPNTTMSVLVPYDEGEDIIAKLCSKITDYREIQMLLQKAQRYSIEIYERFDDAYQNCFQEISDLGVIILKDRYYDKACGFYVETMAEGYLM